MITATQIQYNYDRAFELAAQLKQRQQKIVFAESCTAGLVGANLAQVPGISEWLCGSAATYRMAVKSQWLQIDPHLFETHSDVSPEVTQAMAEGVLLHTNDADFSVAITGHLEPDASPVGPYAYISVGWRRSGIVSSTSAQETLLKQETRSRRQWEAAAVALRVALEVLSQDEDGPTTSR